MFYELEYDLDSQIAVHSFVRDGYQEMSNAMVGHYLGRPNVTSEDNQMSVSAEEEKEDFIEWMQ